MLREEFLLHAIQGELGDVEQYEASGSLTRDLTAQLAADRPPRPGDHHVPVGDAGPQQRRVRRDRIAAEEVFHGDIAELVESPAAGDEIVQGRNRQHVQSEGGELIEDQLAFGPGRGRQRQEHGLGELFGYIFTGKRGHCQQPD